MATKGERKRDLCSRLITMVNDLNRIEPDHNFLYIVSVWMNSLEVGKVYDAYRNKYIRPLMGIPSDDFIEALQYEIDTYDPSIHSRTIYKYRYRGSRKIHHDLVISSEIVNSSDHWTFDIDEVPPKMASPIRDGEAVLCWYCAKYVKPGTAEFTENGHIYCCLECKEESNGKQD